MMLLNYPIASREPAFFLNDGKSYGPIMGSQGTLGTLY